MCLKRERESQCWNLVSNVVGGGEGSDAGKRRSLTSQICRGKWVVEEEEEQSERTGFLAEIGEGTVIPITLFPCLLLLPLLQFSSVATSLEATKCRRMWCPFCRSSYEVCGYEEWGHTYLTRLERHPCGHHLHAEGGQVYTHHFVEVLWQSKTWGEIRVLCMLSWTGWWGEYLVSFVEVQRRESPSVYSNQEIEIVDGDCWWVKRNGRWSEDDREEWAMGCCAGIRE